MLDLNEIYILYLLTRFDSENPVNPVKKFNLPLSNSQFSKIKTGMILYEPFFVIHYDRIIKLVPTLCVGTLTRTLRIPSPKTGEHSMHGMVKTVTVWLSEAASISIS